MIRDYDIDIDHYENDDSFDFGEWLSHNFYYFCGIRFFN